MRQDIEFRHRECQASTEVLPATMGNFLEVTDGSQHRQHCLNDHSDTPFVMLTYLQVLRVSFFRMEPAASQDHHLFLKLSNQEPKDVSWTLAVAHVQPKLVYSNGEFATHDPTVV